MGTLGFRRKGSHTRAYTPKQGVPFLRPQCGFVPSVKFLLFRHAFIYIHFPVLCEPHYISRGKNSGQSCRHKFIPPTAFHSDFQLLAQTAHVRFHRRKRVHLGLRRKIAHKRLHGETRGVSDGGAITTLGCSTRFGNPAWPGFKTANLAAFGSWLDVLPKNRKPAEQRCA